ncbi:choice-of-anchor A family protein [Corynebacterium sp. CCM 8864]|uniref:Choice-of-anchor A family protein n=2 Tax=Corynebacterium marambiense TaxID=2765364 RepID=A0ABS0VW15_9CORY|nr:choice-of-anchor A family protein [Corynebacterium marambiense]
MIENSVHGHRVKGVLKRVTTVSSALILGMMTCVVTPVASGAEDAVVSTCEIDPMKDYRSWNVVAFEDLTVSAESEGSMGVGGTLSFRETNVATHSKNTARAEGYDRTIGLVVGRLNLGTPTSGELKVLDGDLILENREGVEFAREGGSGEVLKFVVAEGKSRDSRPRVVLNNRLNKTLHEPGAFGKIFGSQDNAREISARIAVAASEGLGAEPTVTWEGAKVSISLKPGETNVWSVTPEQISKITELKFQGVSPGVNSGSALIVNVVGDGPVTFTMNMAGNRDPRAILWNMPGVEQIYQKGDSLDGSILAPLADLQKTKANIQGTLVIKGGVLGGSEQHFFPFTNKVKVPCEATPGTGSFSVSKNVNGDYTPSSDEKFRITYVCDDADNTSGVFELPGDGVPVKGPVLPEGTTCKISEETSSAERDGYLVETTYTGNPVTITADSTSDAQVTNKYTKPVAGFSITKAVNGVTSAHLDPDHEFKFRYSCNDPDRSSGEVLVKPNGEKAVVVSDVPIGTACVVSEDTTGSQIAEYTLKEPADQTVTVSTDFPTAHFVNDYTVVTSTPSSTVTTPSSTVTTPSSTVTTPSSTVTTPSSTVTTPSSTVTTPSSTVTTPSSTVTTPSSTVTTPGAAPPTKTSSILPAESQPPATTPRNVVLAKTGADVKWLVCIAAIAVLLGGLLLALKRRKN